MALKRILTVVVLVFISFSLGACAPHDPVRHLSADVCLLIPGRTTKQEILTYLGPPDLRQADPNDGEVWFYYQANKSALRKLPYVGEKLGSEDFDLVKISFAGDVARTCVYRSLSDEEFKKLGIPADVRPGE